MRSHLFGSHGLHTVGLLLLLGFWMKEQPVLVDRLYLPLAAMAAVSLQLGFEMLKIPVGVRRAREMKPDNKRKLAMILVSLLACVCVLVLRHESHEEGKGDEYSWCLLSLACFFQFSHTINTMFIPWQNLGIFALVVERLKATDVQVFLT